MKRTSHNKFKCIQKVNKHQHAPTHWKIGTLKSHINRPKTICSNENLLKTKTEYQGKVFLEINSYPRHIVNRVIR